MEPLAYIYAAMICEENARIDREPIMADRRVSWWQMSGATAIVTLIILGGFTKVVTAFASPTATPVQQLSTVSQQVFSSQKSHL